MSENPEVYDFSRIRQADLLSQGNDSSVYRASALVFKRYNAQRVSASSVENYINLTNAAAVKGRLINDFAKVGNIKYKVHAHVEPVLALEDYEGSKVAVSKYVEGQRGEDIIPSPVYEKDFYENIKGLPIDEQQRLIELRQTLETIGLDSFYRTTLIREIRNYGPVISQRLKRVKNENPEIEIGLENVRLRIPKDKEIEITITDLCLMIE